MGNPVPVPACHGVRWLSRCLAVAVALLSSLTASAQPQLTFHRVVVPWPTVELYFSAQCGGNPAYNLTTSDIRIHENDVPVGNFTLWCPDPTVRCAISAALVFDASGSMSGANNTGAKQGGHAFVDLMDGVIDEAAIVFFSAENQVWVEQQMTTVKPLLHAAVDNLPVLGMTAVWDGIYTGVTEVINHGVNQCQAVIAMTDGGDNSSTRQPSEIISLANRHHIRVFTIGVGSGINAPELELIAVLTGGRYYQTPNASQLAAIFSEIHTLISKSFQECMITYERDCADGAMREVDLLLSNFCGGSDMKTKTYRALLDSTTYTDLQMGLGEVEAAANADVKLPLHLITPISGEMFYPFSFTLLFDAACMQFLGASMPSGALLEGLPLTITPVAGGVRIAITDRRILHGSGKLIEFTFHTSSPADSAHCFVQAVDARFEQGCFDAVISPGTVRIRSHTVPVISAGGPTTFCEGGSVILTASSGFTSYRWSSGQTSRSITVSQSGSYTVTAVDGLGRQSTSSPMEVVVLPLPAPVITPSGSVSICMGGSVELDAGAGFSSYQWSNGQQQRKITVNAAGAYAVTVKGSNGCSGTSAPVVVVVSDSLHPVITAGGPTTFCEGGSVLLDAGAGYVSYRWSNGATTRQLAATTSGAYAVTVTDDRGCVGLSLPITVLVQPAPSVSITAGGPTTICAGDSVVLTANPSAASYRWSTGETSRSIVARSMTAYYVTATNTAGCSATSAAVYVTVQPVPPKPVISRSGDVLTTPAAFAYQWYYNGVALQGSTNQFLVAGMVGAYQVKVTAENGCSSMSDPFAVNVLSVSQPGYVTAFDLYPDPNDGILQLRLTSERPVPVSIEVMDMLGQRVLRVDEPRPVTRLTRQLDLGAAAAGIYMLRITTGTDSWTRRFVRR